MAAALSRHLQVGERTQAPRRRDGLFIFTLREKGSHKMLSARTWCHRDWGKEGSLWLPWGQWSRGSRVDSGGPGRPFQWSRWGVGASRERAVAESMESCGWAAPRCSARTIRISPGEEERGRRGRGQATVQVLGSRTGEGAT